MTEIWYTNCDGEKSSMKNKDRQHNKGAFITLETLLYFQLNKPNDDDYNEFWVDFNYGTRRITLFCEQDIMEVNSQNVSFVKVK